MFRSGKPKLNETQLTQKMNPNAVTRLVVSPVSNTVLVDQVVHATVTAYNRKGHLVALPAGLTITVLHPELVTATVSSLGDVTITGVAPGTTSFYVRALSLVSNSAALTVPSPLTLASLSITAPSGPALIGASYHLTITARNSLGDVVPVPDDTTIDNTNPSVASAVRTGTDVLVTGLAAGSTTLSAISNPMSGLIQSNAVTASIVADTTNDVVSLALSAPVGTISIGSSQHLAIVARNAAGTIVPVPDGTTISNSNPSIASAVRTVDDVLVTGLAAGITTLRAVFGSVRSSAVSASVADPTVVTSLTLSPSSLGLVAGNVGHATLTARNYLANVIAIPAGVTLTNTAPSKAGGVLTGSDLAVTAIAAGSASIIAHYGGVDSNAVAVTVTAAPIILVPTSFRVTPASLTPQAATTIGLTVQLLDQNGGLYPSAGISITLADNLGSGATFGFNPIVTNNGGTATGTITVALDDTVNHRIVATAAGGLTGTSAIIDVQPIPGGGGGGGGDGGEAEPGPFADVIFQGDDADPALATVDAAQNFDSSSRSGFTPYPGRFLYPGPVVSQMRTDGLKKYLICNYPDWPDDGSAFPTGGDWWLYPLRNLDGSKEVDISFDFQINTPDPSRLVNFAIKFIEIYHVLNGARMQTCLHNRSPWNGRNNAGVLQPDHGTYLQFTDGDAPLGNSDPALQQPTDVDVWPNGSDQGTQVRGPYVSSCINSGDHHYRCRYKQHTSALVLDGFIKTWLDGVKVQHIAADKVGVEDADAEKQYCGDTTMRLIAPRVGQSLIAFGGARSTFTGAAFTLDIHAGSTIYTVAP